VYLKYLDSSKADIIHKEYLKSKERLMRGRRASCFLRQFPSAEIEAVGKRGQRFLRFQVREYGKLKNVVRCCAIPRVADPAPQKEQRECKTELLIRRVARDTPVDGSGTQKSGWKRSGTGRQMNLSRIVRVSMNTRPIPVSLFLRGFFTVIFGGKYCRVEQCDRSRSLIRLHSATRSEPGANL